MKFKAIKVVAAFAALTTLAAACGSDKKAETTTAASSPASSTSEATASSPATSGTESTESSSPATSGSEATSSTAGSSTTAAGGDAFTKLGGWKDPACSDSQPKVEVAISAPLDVPGVSLTDYVDATQAAVTAFNGRGGINGRCMDLKVCDGKGDGPTELACARGEVDDTSVVAGLTSTFTASEADAYQLFEAAGLSQVGAQVTQPGAWNSPVSYDFTMGGVGTLFAGMPALKSVGVTKFVVFLPASGQSGALQGLVAPLVTALGMDLLELVQIPPTAVEFTQFVLAAQNAGAEGGVLGLPADTAGQVIDAADSVQSELNLSASWGTFSQKGVTEAPASVTKNMAFTDAVPPAVSTTPEKWPIFDVIVDDFKASGKANLTRDAMTAQATNGWLSVYALVKVMRDAKPADITRETVKTAFDAATDVPMFDLVPPWTPAKQSTNGLFKGISNPNYWTGHWDPDKKAFVIDDQQVDIIALLG